MFTEVDMKRSFPALEQDIEQWWRENNIINKVLDSGDRSRPFIFFEGPPTANGRPGVHHIEHAQQRMSSSAIIACTVSMSLVHVQVGIRMACRSSSRLKKCWVSKASRTSRSLASQSSIKHAKRVSGATYRNTSVSRIASPSGLTSSTHISLSLIHI